MKKQNIIFAIFTVMILMSRTVIFTPSVLNAQDTLSKEKDWLFNLSPFYLWGVTIDGDVTSGTNTVPVDAPFSNLVDNLEAAFIVHFEFMHKSNWGFIVDINYLMDS